MHDALLADFTLAGPVTFPVNATKLKSSAGTSSGGAF